MVDFPHPDSPTTPSVSPVRMEKFTSSTAWRVPLGVVKYFFRCSTRNISVFCSCICQSPFLSGSGCSGPGGFRLQSPSPDGSWNIQEPHTCISRRKRSPQAAWWGRASCRQWPEAVSHRLSGWEWNQRVPLCTGVSCPCIFPAGFRIPPLPPHR